MNPLPGSLTCHAHLFKLVQLLTYFTLKRRQKEPNITTKDILIKWLASSEGDDIRLRVGSDSLVDNLNNLVMPFVLTVMNDPGIQIEKFGLSEPQAIKDEILYIINEYWLPF